MNQKELVKNIESTCAIKVVNDLKNLDENLYQEVSKAAKNTNESVKTFIENLGFKYSRKPLGAILAEDVFTLDNLYPEKEIKNLAEVDGKLYYRLLSHSKLLDMDIKKYLNFLGFNYCLQKEEITRDYILSELEALYKDKNITKLSVNQPQLYSKIYKFAQKENVSITELVESMGFKIDLEDNYKNNRRRVNNKSKRNNKKLNNSTVVKTNPKKVDVSEAKETILPKEEIQSKVEATTTKKKVGRPRKNPIPETTESR